MKVEPVADMILIEQPEQKEEKTPGGIVVPARRRQEYGDLSTSKVLAVGPGKIEHGVHVKVLFEKGDVVVYREGSGVEVIHDDERCELIHASDVVAVVKE